MTNKFNSFENQQRPPRERFELLSAYLDGEVTADERKLVQHWLDTDPKFQLLHRRMLELRQGLQKMPVPASSQSAEQLSATVFKKIDQRQRQRKALLWGGPAIAALFLGLFTTIIPKTGFNPFQPEFAQNQGDSEPLQIALNRPTVPLSDRKADEIFGHISPRPVR